MPPPILFDKKPHSSKNFIPDACFLVLFVKAEIKTRLLRKNKDSWISRRETYRQTHTCALEKVSPMD